MDLKHGNDLITPVAALLALGAGGTIVGAEHAAFKETDRTNGTVALLAQFWLKSTYEEGRLIVPGGQTIVAPRDLVETYGDHRMQMTALVLAMGSPTPVLIEGDSLHEVADPEAIARWEAVGVTLSVSSTNRGRSSVAAEMVVKAVDGYAKKLGDHARKPRGLEFVSCPRASVASQEASVVRWP